MMPEGPRDIEQRLRAVCMAGGVVDLSGDDEKRVPAQLVAELLTTPCATEGERRALRLVGAQIIGEIDLQGITLVRALSLTDCDVTSLILANADAHEILVIGCAVGSLNARQLHTRGDLNLTGSRITGGVGLSGAQIGGQLILTDAALINKFGAAFAGDRLQVGLDMLCDRGFFAVGGVQLSGAQILGRLSFTSATVANDSGLALNAEGLKVGGDMLCEHLIATGGIGMLGAHVEGRLVFSSARLTNRTGPALIANALQVDRGMFCLRGFTAVGEILMIRARVGGQLSFNDGARLANHGGPALNADGLRVEGHMLCRDDFIATGGVILAAAHVEGNVEFVLGVTLASDSGPALNAERLQVDGDMYCRDEFSAIGGVLMLGANIAGQLEFTGGATLTHDSGLALNAQRLRVGGSMYCRDFRAIGDIQLHVANIGSQLDFSRATLSGPGVSLNLESAAAKAVLLRFAEQPRGLVNLTGARFELYGDRTYGRAQEWARCRLVGCRYDFLHAEPEPQLRRRVLWFAQAPAHRHLRWLAEAPVAGRLRWLASSPDGFAPQPYEQLADFYRRSGEDGAARRVLIAKQRRRSRTATAWPVKAWSWFLGSTVGHGYRLWYAGVWLVLLWAITSVLFDSVFQATTKPPGDLTPAKPDTAPPSFEPVLYAADVLLPVLNVGQKSAWNAHGAAQWVAAGATFLGWMLASAFVAGLIVRRA